uniref:RBR-type E3 ubiquitin transferase n=1 Tax=Pelusios castaneus TaxID=367368 RepID=A0A8C8RZU2_9SAUR
MAQAEDALGEPQFLQLREELVLALVQSPGELHPETVQQLVEAPLPLQVKYREIDVRGILCPHTQGQSPACLRTISTALNILEKYGRNLLSPVKPRFWRGVKFNNPVFRSTVDAVQGGRDVLRLYGYTEEQLDGLSFPEGLAEPDARRVASVTVDVVLLRAELNLLLSANSIPETVPPGSLSQMGPSSPAACLLCGLEPASLRCPECEQSLCPECDQLFHKHPARAQHRRQSLGEPGWGASAPGQSLPMEPAGAHPALPPKPRPPWLCAACHTPNEALAVLCTGCDRPRGCPTPPNPLPDGESPRGSWACQSCTFLNASATVLCAVCERPRLAGRPGPPDLRRSLDDLPHGPTVQAGGEPGWQCEHCTFWNQLPGRVCEVCNRTSQRGGPSPHPLLEEKGLQRPSKSHPLGPEEVEQRRQEKLREDGMKLVALIREAELVGVPPEEVWAAQRYSGAELPLPWLRTELPAVLETVAELATRQGEDTELGAITQQEARTAWVQSEGDLDEAISRCLGARRSKVRELAALGFKVRGPVLGALYQNGGDVWGALTELQRQELEPFHRRLWDPVEPHIDLQAPNHQALLRRLLASLALPSWGRAELVLSLAREQEAAGGRAALADIVDAVRASPDRAFIRRLLNWECAVCGWALPRNQMQSLTSCECTICPDCFAQHFTIAVKEKHITDLVCPACDAPDLSDEAALLGYFSTLDIQLRECLDPETYELFSKKLTERELMRDPKFQWCTHCSFGFIYESEQAAAQCPQCNQSFCVHCKRAWEPQHQGLSCQEFQEWKRTNDPQYQAQGLAVYLQENGIACPKCKFPYALARGGCMHFQCSQCRHQFCSGCYGPFHTKNKCPVPGCLVRQSLHGHHPRDCLFYLRDWDVGRLQHLLQDNGVIFNTEPPAGTRPTPGGGCRVMEQKETLSGLRDEACGKETPPGYAGLCQAHYKEYLVSLINARALDPAHLYSLPELETVYRRHLGTLPPRTPTEPDDTYHGRLLQKLMDEVPLGPKIPRQRP